MLLTKKPLVTILTSFASEKVLICDMETTLNIKQEYLLQFLSQTIDSDIYREIFVTSPCMTSVPKQRQDITYREKNGDVAVR